MGRKKLPGPRQDVEDTENSLLFNIWGFREWLPGKHFDDFMGDHIKYKRIFFELGEGNLNRKPCTGQETTLL